jgi:hypothetical protein
MYSSTYNMYTFIFVLHSTKIKSFTARNKLYENELQGFVRRCWYLGKNIFLDSERLAAVEKTALFFLPFALVLYHVLSGVCSP